jgi:putative transposase
MRYVERNALRARLVERAEAWRWSSLWRRVSPGRDGANLLHVWPKPVPRGWLRHVNLPQTEAELKAIRQAVQRSAPFTETDGRRCEGQIRVNIRRRSSPSIVRTNAE